MKIEGKLDKALLAVGFFVGAIFWLVVGYVFIEDFLNKGDGVTILQIDCAQVMVDKYTIKTPFEQGIVWYMSNGDISGIFYKPGLCLQTGRLYETP